MSNVIVHKRALECHSALRHILAMGCEKAVMQGAMQSEMAQELQTHARTKMNSADLRLSIELIFELLHITKLARDMMPKILAAPTTAAQQVTPCP